MSMRRRGGIGFLDPIGCFTQRPCGAGVCGDWSDIDSLRKLPVELGRLARMACTDADAETDRPFPFFSGLSRLLAGQWFATLVDTECDRGVRCRERDG